MKRRQQEPTRINSDFFDITGIRKVYEYRMFIIWLSFPPKLRKMGKEMLKDKDLDNEEMQLIFIPNQRAFAKKFGLDEDTLTAWKKRSSFRWNLFEEIIRKTFQKYYATIVYSFSLATIKHGDAARFGLWMETFANFETKPTKEAELEDREVNDDDIELAELVVIRLRNERRKEREKQQELEQNEHN